MFLLFLFNQSNHNSFWWYFVTNQLIDGFTSYFCSNRGFDANIGQKYEIRWKGPVLQLIGPYSIKGKVLILPIQGVGISNMTISK